MERPLCANIKGDGRSMKVLILWRWFRLVLLNHTLRPLVDEEKKEWAERSTWLGAFVPK